MTLREEKVKKIELEEMKTPKKKKEAVITVDQLKTYYPIYGGLFKRKIGNVKAVDGVSFKLYKNETLGLVGESGCGKTTIGNTILNLVEPTEGSINLEGQRIWKKKKYSLKSPLKSLIDNPITKKILTEWFKGIFLYMSSVFKKKFKKRIYILATLPMLPLMYTFSSITLLYGIFMAIMPIIWMILIVSTIFIIPMLSSMNSIFVTYFIIEICLVWITTVIFSRYILSRLYREFYKKRSEGIKKVYHELKPIFKELNKQIKFDIEIRKKIQMVFQDPDSSLNPRWKIVDVIGEPLKILLGMRKGRNIRRRVLELLETVSMKSEHLDRFPHEFSGGQKQRIVISRALACNPKVIILDEPTSALDVSVQAQILNLLKDLQRKFGLSFLFITHDLTVVQHIADRIAVMYLGKFVETGTIQEVFYNPTHPYTKALLSARPTFDPTSKRKRIILEGDVPSPINPPEGCPFHPRCQEKDKHIGCGIENPRKIHLGGDHYIMCLPFKKEEKSYEGWEFISD